jgi:hypothetical protein
VEGRRLITATVAVEVPAFGPLPRPLWMQPYVARFATRPDRFYSY